MTVFSTDVTPITCPYCGETFDIVVDCSVPQQSYIEDCYVCCRPISLSIRIQDDGESMVTASSENESSESY